jgi:hypothetical protein
LSGFRLWNPLTGPALGVQTYSRSKAVPARIDLLSHLKR